MPHYSYTIVIFFKFLYRVGFESKTQLKRNSIPIREHKFVTNFGSYTSLGVSPMVLLQKICEIYYIHSYYNNNNNNNMLSW